MLIFCEHILEVLTVLRTELKVDHKQVIFAQLYSSQAEQELILIIGITGERKLRQCRLLDDDNNLFILFIYLKIYQSTA